jgi:putative FmdB family regulatory protein
MVEYRAVGGDRSQERCVRRGERRERERGDGDRRGQARGAARAPPEPGASLAAPMPIYEYKCPNGHLFDAFHGMTEAGPTVCTVCGEGPLQVVLHPVAVHYKGSGFYSTDYGRKSRQPAKDSGSGDSSSGSSGGESGGGSGGDSGGSSSQGESGGGESKKAAEA